MSTLPSSPQLPAEHSFDNSNGWQVWDSTSLRPVTSTPSSPRPRSSSTQPSRSPNPTRPWVDTASSDLRSFITGAALSSPSVSIQGTTGPAFPTGHRYPHPHLETSLSFSNSSDSSTLRSAPFLRPHDSTPLLPEEQQPYNVITSSRQVIPQTIPYNVLPPEFHIPYYRPSNEVPYPMAPEASYFPSHLLSPTHPSNLYPSIPHNIPLHQNPADLSPRQPGFVFDYTPPHSMPFIFPTHPYLIPPLGRPPHPSSAIPHFEHAVETQHSPTRPGHSPRSHSESYTFGSRQFRQRSGTLPLTSPFSGQPEFSNARIGRREVPPRVRPCIPKNSLLEQFRNSRDRNWEFSDIRGSMAEFAGDQYGSRFIQEKLQNADPQEVQWLFDELLPSKVLPLMTDVFGNYVVQKMFEHGTQSQKSTLVHIMKSHTLQMTLHMYGCRVIQKAIETIPPDEQAIFVHELSPNILHCVKDANGNHVVQRLVQSVPSERLTFLGVFRDNILDLASHPYGCRVLQRCLEHLPSEHSQPLVASLASFTNQLVQNQFGNYVMQYVLEHGRQEDRAGVIEAMRPSFVALSRHKYASNVCEKALTCGNVEERRSLIHTLVGEGDEERAISLLMRDQYANYVLQKALVVVEGEQKDRLFRIVRVVADTMKQASTGFSKNLLAIDKLLEKYSESPPTVT